mmetsp:Transcript_52839/g.92788  ORF Transcript_52839/g.92788 Transcript_52839/m.92788 type:complete len:219 (-) Transcript_52839:998-1654(-)
MLFFQGCDCRITGLHNISLFLRCDALRHNLSLCKVKISNGFVVRFLLLLDALIPELGELFELDRVVPDLQLQPLDHSILLLQLTVFMCNHRLAFLCDVVQADLHDLHLLVRSVIALQLLFDSDHFPLGFVKILLREIHGSLCNLLLLVHLLLNGPLLLASLRLGLSHFHNSVLERYNLGFSSLDNFLQWLDPCLHLAHIVLDSAVHLVNYILKASPHF